MVRQILDAENIHDAIKKTIATNQENIMDEVTQAIKKNDIVIIGMSANPHVKSTKKTLEAKNLDFAYLGYGGYLSQWRKRNALKMWTGWPTFPMVFVKGILIGGGNETRELVNNGELDKMLS